MAKKFLTWNFTIIYMIYVLSFVQCENKVVKVKWALIVTKFISSFFKCISIFQYFQDTPITYDDINYKQFWKICANWSTTSKKSDWSSSYPVVTYTKYASTIDEFISKYPYVSIETSFQATSDCFDSDQQVPLHSETLAFETRYFLKTQYTDRHVVFIHHNGFSYDVGAETGFGFRSENNILYVRPYINGWVYKAGAFWSCLQFGLSASSITFSPKHPNDL